MYCDLVGLMIVQQSVHSSYIVNITIVLSTYFLFNSESK